MLRLRCYEASLRLSRAKIRSRLGLAVEPCWLAQANELSKEMPVWGWRWAVCGKSQAVAARLLVWFYCSGCVKNHVILIDAAG